MRLNKPNFVLCILLLFLLFSCTPSTASSSVSQLLETCPNPYGSDEAEYVMFFCSSECTLSDGEGLIRAKPGFHIAAKNTSAFEIHFGKKADIEFPSEFALSNEGEKICLTDRSGKDCFDYSFYLDDGVVYYRANKKWDFRYEDWSNFSCLNDTVKLKLIATPSNFELSDGYTVASYTFAAHPSPSELFVDASPAGSIPCRELELSNVHFLESSSYRNFHYKFAIKDDSVIITTENWIFTKKGFIVQFDSQRVAEMLRNVLENDLKYEVERPEKCRIWRVGEPSGEGEEMELEAEITFFVLPDCNPIFDLISSAKQRLIIMVPYIDFRWYGTPSPLLEGIKLATYNGAKVMVYLNEKYAKNEVVEILRSLGAEVHFNSRIHGKAIVADNRLLITSANLNMHGLKLNREIGIIIRSEEAADFAAKTMAMGRQNSFRFYILIPPLIVFIFALILAKHWLR